jgi:copper chaperone CopZ
MTHKYNLSGMTCSSCESKVKSALLSVEDVTKVSTSKNENMATITMSQHIDISELQKALDPKYTISAFNLSEVSEQAKSWLETYKPLLLTFFYISLVTVMVQFQNDKFDTMQWMNHFMAGFFIVFSFFKLLNIEGFADNYKMYDLIAKHIPVWGYIYTFLELGLGIAYLINFNPFLTNLTTFIVLTISILGVIQAAINKEKIQCACLGVIFNIPMSTVTIVEDALMIVMSGYMLFILF